MSFVGHTVQCLVMFGSMSDYTIKLTYMATKNIYTNNDRHQEGIESLNITK